ncbi:MAG TPA: ATP-binding protein [Lachnospiraceae bacterium]|nr:ATP-binding protein [Lachnospiraceae bacterium]
MFIGRENELNTLHSLWNANSFACALIYGKKYVGKTSLIAEFSKGKKTIFFSALPSTESDNLASFSKALFSCISPATHTIPVFDDFETILQNIDTFAQKERVLLVIDNFSNLYRSSPDILKLLQRFVEHEFAATNLFLILADASLNFMTDTMMSSKSPLYGLYSVALKLEPFDYKETAQFFPDYTPEDKALVYGITGGIPYYLEKLDAKADIKSNIMSAFFLRNALFAETPSMIMKQELRELTTYNAILTAIANGSVRLNEIAERAGLETGLCVKYLKALASMDIIEKETPVASRDRKKSFYQISDYMFRFWYRFVPANMSHIASGRIFLSYLTAVEDHLPAYMEDIFYDIAKEYLVKYCSFVPFQIHNIGCFWGKDEQNKIDLLATDIENEHGLFGTLQYTSGRPMDVSDLHDLMKKSEAVKMVSTRHYCLINRSGFTDVLKAKAADEGVLLITLPQLYR